jgi:hypothetical protein
MGFFGGLGGVLGGLGGLLGGGSLFKSVFGADRSKNPYQSGVPYLNQIPGILENYNSGFANLPNTYGTLESPYGNSTNPNDAGDLLNKLMSQYSTSPGYDFKKQRILGAARNSAASGGFAGTKYDQEQQGSLANNLLNEDMGGYLENIFKILGGKERFGFEKAQGTQQYNLAKAAARAGLGDSLANLMSSRASLANNAQNYENEQRNAKREQRAQLFASLISAFGGGFNGGSPLRQDRIRNIG